jgi:hypothetical protein
MGIPARLFPLSRHNKRYGAGRNAHPTARRELCQLCKSAAENPFLRFHQASSGADVTPGFDVLPTPIPGLAEPLARFFRFVLFSITNSGPFRGILVRFADVQIGSAFLARLY